MQKNGGNVASYFCTPDARVIHAVGKNVSGDQLLKEARWAVDAIEHARQVAPENTKRQIAIVEEAHLTALHTNTSTFEREVKNQLTHAKEGYVKKVKQYAKHRSDKRNEYRYDEIVSPQLAARRMAAERFGGSRAHQILAAEPLAPFAKVRRRIFEKLTGERFNLQRQRVFSAAEGFELARERGRPILLVLYKGHGKYQDKLDNTSKHLLEEVFRERPVSQPLQSYVVITLPLRELAALSNLAELPPYQLASKTSSSLVMADSDGKQIDAINGSVHPDQLARQLWPAVNQSYLSRAESLASEGKTSDALRLLRRVLRTPMDEEMRQQVDKQINELTIQLADNWAENGRTTSALRLLRQVETAALDTHMRQRAGERIAQIRSQL